MRMFKTLRGVGVAVCLAAGLSALMASGALAASPIYLCIGTQAGQGVTSGGTTGACPKATKKVTYDSVALPSQPAEQQKLLALLPYIKLQATGIGGKPTVQISGANVQILSGSGSTAGAVNGAGNLILGYDESPGKQTGSHNLVLGKGQEYTSYAAIIGGENNHSSGPFSDVFGNANTASGLFSSVSGGALNTASKPGSAVSGGSTNIASGEVASVSGGIGNTASGGSASVSGGIFNKVTGFESSVSGGSNNTASGFE